VRNILEKEGKRQLGKLEEDARIILKCIVQKYIEDMYCIFLDTYNNVM
jgi:hypothetical protein